MSRTIKRNKVWLIPSCVLFLAAVLFFGLQQMDVHGQGLGGPGAGVAGGPGAAPGGPAAGGATAAQPSTPAQPTFGLKSILPSGVAVSRIKNWDGTVTEMLRFKYKSMSGRTMTVHLPGVYRTEQRTRAGWDTLFACYAMDYEAMQDQIQKNKAPDVSVYMPLLMAEIQGKLPEGTFSDITGAAKEKASTYLSEMGVGSLEMPPALPGMP